MWPGAPRPQSPNEWRNGSCGPLMAFDVSNLNNMQKPFFSPNQCQVSFAFPYLNKLLKFHIDKRLGPTSQLSALFFLLKILRGPHSLIKRARTWWKGCRMDTSTLNFTDEMKSLCRRFPSWCLPRVYSMGCGMFIQPIFIVCHVQSTLEDIKINNTLSYHLMSPGYILDPLKCTPLQGDGLHSLTNTMGF